MDPQTFEIVAEPLRFSTAAAVAAVGGIALCESRAGQ
jgi:hypothetical protein